MTCVTLLQKRVDYKLAAHFSNYFVTTVQSRLRHLAFGDRIIGVARQIASIFKERGTINYSDTCTGFLLGGIGELNAKRQKNFFVVNKDTTINEITEAFNTFINRQDMAIVMITQKIAEEIRPTIDAHSLPIPSVLEIPSKDFPYDSSKDSILKRAKGMFSADDFR